MAQESFFGLSQTWLFACTPAWTVPNFASCHKSQIIFSLTVYLDLTSLLSTYYAWLHFFPVLTPFLTLTWPFPSRLTSSFSKTFLLICLFIVEALLLLCVPCLSFCYLDYFIVDAFYSHLWSPHLIFISLSWILSFFALFYLHTVIVKRSYCV